MIINPGDNGLDYATSRPSPALMQQRGIKFVCRYLTEYGLKGKAITKSELALYALYGIPVVLNYEKGPDTMLGGTNAGQIAAQEAIAAATKLGAPTNETVCIVYSHDTGAWSPLVVSAFKAAFDITIAAGFTFGVYGSRQCVDALLGAGLQLDIIWATNAVGWGGGRSQYAHIWQGPRRPSPTFPFDEISWLQSKGYTLSDASGMGTVDLNIAIRPFAAWLPGEHKPDTPTPTPAITRDNDNMQRLVYTTDGLGIWLIDYRLNTIAQMTDPSEADVLRKIGTPSNYADPSTYANQGDLDKLTSIYTGLPAAPPMGPTGPLNLNITGSFTGTGTSA